MDPRWKDALKLDMETQVGMDSVCAICVQGKECSDIYSKIRYIEHNLDRLPEIQKRQFYQIKNHLEIAGFDFPKGSGFCDLAQDEQSVMRILDELREVIVRSRNP